MGAVHYATGVSEKSSLQRTKSNGRKLLLGLSKGHIQGCSAPPHLLHTGLSEGCCRELHGLAQKTVRTQFAGV